MMTLSSGREPRSPETVLRLLLGLATLAALVYGTAQAVRPGFTATGGPGLGLTVAVAVGWLGWLVARRTRRRMAVVAVLLLGLTGALVTGLSSFGAVLLGVAGFCAAVVFDLPRAAAVSGAGLAVATAMLVAGGELNRLPEVAVGVLAGLLVGAGRRQQQARIRQEAELALARQRSEIEHERAELFSERIRLSREVHDVLAHTLSAVSVQLTALDALVEDEAGAVAVRAGIQRTRRLVVDALHETRHTVRALRDEPVDLTDRLRELAGRDGAAFVIRGVPVPVSPSAGLALLRVAQESLTNVRKHAPGVTARVELHFSDDLVRVAVTNDAASSPSTSLTGTGGGYGLLGLRERVELLGGAFDAGRHDNSWRVHAEIPL